MEIPGLPGVRGVMAKFTPDGIAFEPSGNFYPWKEGDMKSNREEFGPRPLPVGVTIESYSIGAWCPTPDGSGPPEAVAIQLNIPGLGFPLFMRLKSRRAVDEMIEVLAKHRDDVWK